MFKPKGPTIVHHLISHEVLRKESQSQTTCVCFHFTPELKLICDSEHPDGRLFNLKLKPNEKALILFVKMVYCKNNTGQDIDMCLELFQPEKESENENKKHPDYSGKIHFSVRHNAPGIIPKQDRILYEPNLFNLGINILPYAGTEHAILHGRSTVVTTEESDSERTRTKGTRGDKDEFVLFNQGDPFVVFLLEHRSSFPEIQKEDITLVLNKSLPSPLYKISKPVVERVKSFFERAIFPLFHYVEGDYLQLTWNPVLKNSPSGGIYDGFAMIKMMLTIDYIIIAPEVPKFNCTSLELGI